MLTFIIEQPDTPISAVYKALSLSWRAGNQLRDSLTKEGYLTEIEMRLGKAGRPVKVFLPTFSAYALLGKDSPPGRGGAVHRHIQQLVQDGATARGYSARLEHALGNGAIVDIHLENGQERIAIEIAVISTPERELTHIKQCLSVGYDHVYTIFFDETLLQKTATAIQETCSQEEKGRVRLLPVSKLSHLGI